MKRLTRLLILSTITISGIGCKTLELVHDDVRCKGVPPLAQTFTDEEKANTPQSVLNKFFIRSGELQERIKANCKDAQQHNEQYKD